MLPLRAKAWLLIVVLEAAAFVPRGAFAQSSNVTCLSSFRWMNNTIGQDPCVVTSYLISVCRGAFKMIPLPPNTYYAPEGNNCTCSTVTYSMMGACSDCQNGSYLSWSSWSSSCSKMSIGEYPNNIPAGTRVPNWAYLNVTGGFDPVAAQNNGDLPESTAASVPTTTVTYSTTLSASLTTVYTSLTSSSATATGLSTTSASSSTSSNVRAIAGGVVGAILGTTIIGLVIWFLVKRRRSSTTPSPVFSDIGGVPGHTQSFYSTNTNIFPMAQQSRLYDPSDPTTFPGHLLFPPGPIASSSNINWNPSMPSSVFPQQSRPGQYTGSGIRNLECCFQT